MKPTACELCKKKDPYQFAFDARTGEWVCTICGCIVRDWFDHERLGTNFEKEEECLAGKASTDNVMKTEYHRLISRVFANEEVDRKRKKKISDICFKVDAPGLVKNRALLLYEDHKKDLCKIRPTNKMLIACIIVASRGSPGCFIPMSNFRKMYPAEMERISKFTKDVCSVVGLNQKTFSLAAIPYIISNLSLTFKCEILLEQYFEKVSLVIPATAPETRMGVATCKILKEEGRDVDIDYVAFLCDCNVSGIQSFIEKSKKRKRGTS